MLSMLTIATYSRTETAQRVHLHTHGETSGNVKKSISGIESWLGVTYTKESLLLHSSVSVCFLLLKTLSEFKATEPLGTVASHWPVKPPADDRWEWIISEIIIGRRKLKCLKKHVWHHFIRRYRPPREALWILEAAYGKAAVKETGLWVT
jgi:hypothetical protein